MVGLKSVWLLLISLFLFGACVPQSKQTECGSNEAFNSQLRSCVPIVQGPSAFINISSYSPLYTSTRYKHDPLPVVFTIAVSNPYNQTYTIEWEHTYNGFPNNLDGNVLTTSNFIPSLNSSNIGSNVITAKIISGGKVVDSHNFEVIIQDSPTPTINTASITPADYNPILYRDNTGHPFSFQARNNGATGIGSYTVNWTLSQDGVSLPAYDETDTFTNTATNGTNTFYFGSSVTPAFDPSTLGLGSYVLRVKILRSFTDVVGEHQWNITVRDRDFGFVTSAGSPFTGQDTVAFFNLDYGTYPFANSAAAQSRFCVTLSDPDGAYVNGSSSDASNLDIVVRFYKDGSATPIFEGKTDGSSGPVKDTVCFDEASGAEKASLIFNDGSPLVPHYRKISARAFDEQTGREICGVGMPSCPVTYPISWNILVKPLDTGVLGTFRATQPGDNITYTTSLASTRSATVTQSDLVTVRFVPSDGIVGYEGYDMSNPLNAGFFTYDIVVKKSGVTVATIPCKAAAAVFPFTSSPEQACSFTWPGFDSTTNEHLDPGVYQAYLQVTDTGSPVPGSIGTVSNALTINATVTEPVNAPRFNPAPDILDPLDNVLATAAEGANIKFRVRVEEDEHDDYTLRIDYCGLDGTCATPTNIGSDDRSYNQVHYSENTAITYTIPEDVLGTAAAGNVFFKLTLTDKPTNSSKASPSTVTISLPVTNANPDGLFDDTLVTPAVASTYDVFAGYQFSGELNGAIDDASMDTDERPNKFQWFIGTSDDVTDPTVWTAIEGATSSSLRWTPGPELSGTRYLAVCWSDGYPRTDAAAATLPDVDGDTNQRCESVWTITPRTNSAVATTLAGANGEVAVHHVPTERVAYIAYAANDAISVEKVEYRTDGTFGKPMGVVSFSALPSGSADSVKNISLAASNTSLYVAYLADAVGIPGVSYRAHIRRINISNDVATQGGEKSATVFAGTTGSKRKFGFNYNGPTVAPVCTGIAAGNCVWDPIARTLTFNGSAIDTASADNITVNGELLEFEETSLRTTIQICSDCDANGQAQSFAAALNAHPSQNTQGLTATVAANVVTIHGMEVEATEIFASTQAMTGAGKILWSSNTDRWYWPVSNADLAGGQNKIQLLHGPDADVSALSMTVSNVFGALDTVSSIDNGWSYGAAPNMYMAYITLSGAGKISRFQPSGSDFVFVSSVNIVPGAGLSQIQMSPPVSSNPNVFVSSKDNAGQYWISRAPLALGSQVSYKIEDLGADAGQTTILDNDNVSNIAIVPALPAVSGSTNEGRVVVVSKNLGVAYQSYLFRWKTVGTSQVLESTTTVDRAGVETAAGTKLGVSAPTSITLGTLSAAAGSNINNTMGMIRVRDDGEVEFNFLNTDVESINSTTNAAGGEYRAPYVK